MDDLLTLFGVNGRRLEPMAAHTTFRIGGPADIWIPVRRIEDLISAVLAARKENVPYLVLGNGSNVLILDGGWRGVVIENHCDQIQIDPETGTMHAESGAVLSRVANQLARQGWSGLEWAAGIPGTIGGGVIGNAGAHGGCMGDRLLGARILDADDGEMWLPVNKLQLTYRSSRFKHTKGDVILSADLRLDREEPQVCVSRIKEYQEHRRRTQPTELSVGSIFKNPPGDYAGRLIEQAGLKGQRIGGAEISTVHANFFVNRGGATAGDVLKLIDLARSNVREKAGIELELEISVLGEPLPQISG